MWAKDETIYNLILSKIALPRFMKYAKELKGKCNAYIWYEEVWKHNCRKRHNVLQDQKRGLEKRSKVSADSKLAWF